MHSSSFKPNWTVCASGKDTPTWLCLVVSNLGPASRTATSRFTTMHDETVVSFVVGALRDLAYELDRVESLAAGFKNNRPANSGTGANSHESRLWRQALITVGRGEKDG